MRHNAAEDVMHKVSGTFDHLEYMKAVNKPGTSSCHRGPVPSHWLQHHERMASHELVKMLRLTHTELPAAGYSLRERKSETLIDKSPRRAQPIAVAGPTGWTGKCEETKQKKATKPTTIAAACALHRATSRWRRR